MEGPKEEAKANITSGITVPFTSFASYLKHKVYLAQTKSHRIIDIKAKDHRAWHMLS